MFFGVLCFPVKSRRVQVKLSLLWVAECSDYPFLPARLVKNSCLEFLSEAGICGAASHLKSSSG